MMKKVRGGRAHSQLGIDDDDYYCTRMHGRRNDVSVPIATGSSSRSMATTARRLRQIYGRDALHFDLHSPAH